MFLAHPGDATATLFPEANSYAKRKVTVPKKQVLHLPFFDIYIFDHFLRGSSEQPCFLIRAVFPSAFQWTLSRVSPSISFVWTPIRISRFLRAVGDPKSRSKFGLGTSSSFSSDIPQTQTSVTIPEDGGGSATRESPNAVGPVGGSEDQDRSTPGEAERRAIADIFGLVDVDTSGRVSEDELLKTVRNQPSLSSCFPFYSLLNGCIPSPAYIV